MVDHVCSNCGIHSQRGGRCWRMLGMCMKCTKAKHGKFYDTLHCYKCGRTAHNRHSLCWQQGLCGKCYHAKQSKTILRLCTNCNEVALKLRYSKFGYQPLPIYYCQKCHYLLNIKGEYIYNVAPLLQRSITPLCT